MTVTYQGHTIGYTESAEEGFAMIEKAQLQDRLDAAYDCEDWYRIDEIKAKLAAIPAQKTTLTIHANDEMADSSAYGLELAKLKAVQS